MIKNMKEKIASLIKAFLFPVLTSSTVWAVEAYPEDLESSKKSFLISGASYDTLLKEKKGAVTLCFKDNPGTYAHTALVFELFLSDSSQEVSPRLVHYGQRDDYCGAANFAVKLEGTNDTLSKLHRGRKVSLLDGNITELTATYTKYATWYVSNEALIKALSQAEKDATEETKEGNCAMYAAKIMKNMGFTGVDFGWWFKTPDNLKCLAKDYITPKPNHIF